MIENKKLFYFLSPFFPMKLDTLYSIYSVLYTLIYMLSLSIKYIMATYQDQINQIKFFLQVPTYIKQHKKKKILFFCTYIARY